MGRSDKNDGDHPDVSAHDLGRGRAFPANRNLSFLLQVLKQRAA